VDWSWAKRLATPTWLNVATAAGLVGLTSLIALTAPRWASVLRRPLPQAAASDDEPRPEDDAQPTSAPSAEAAEPERTISVKLFFEAADRTGLVQEERTVPFHSDLARQIQAVVEELIKGSQRGFQAPVGSGTRVLQVFVTASGVAYVDLSKEFAVGHVGGAYEEMITAYSIVNSVTTNFPAVRRVQILVEDRPAATLAGHLDLSRPLAPDMTLLAASDLTPVAPSPSPP
jgi:spore germination protein GerM